MPSEQVNSDLRLLRVFAFFDGIFFSLSSFLLFFSHFLFSFSSLACQHRSVSPPHLISSSSSSLGSGCVCLSLLSSDPKRKKKTKQKDLLPSLSFFPTQQKRLPSPFSLGGDQQPSFFLLSTQFPRSSLLLLYLIFFHASSKLSSFLLLSSSSSSKFLKY